MNKFQRPLVKLSNNSTLTNQASIILARLEPTEQATMLEWLQLALRQQSITESFNNKFKF